MSFFQKGLFSKFEWENLPPEIDDLYVEHLIYSSGSDNNFAVVERAGGELWNEFAASQYDWHGNYRFPVEIIIQTLGNQPFTTKDFCLYSNFASFVDGSDLAVIRAHEALIKKINKALAQHIDSAQLVAQINAKSSAEAEALKKLYSDFDGVKILNPRKAVLEYSSGVEFVQFQIDSRGKELEELKHEIENDLWLRLGISTKTELTHITNENLRDSEQAIDLINAYELKRRQNFCKRLNEWRKKHGSELGECSVKIHEITRENSVTKDENGGSAPPTGGNGYGKD